MEDKAVLQRRAHLETAVSERPEWQTAVERLEAEQYEQAAHILQELQAITKQNDDVGLSNILAAATQICLACEQNQKEIRLRQQSLTLDMQRQEEMQQQLRAMLNLVDGQHRLQASSPTASATANGHNQRREASPSLWQRLWNLWGKMAPPDVKTSSNGAHAAADDTKAAISGHEQMELCALPARGKDDRAQPGPSLAVYCLGAFRVYENGRLLDNWSGNKCKSIFKYLAAHRERPIHREILMDLFWPGDDPESARRNLYQAIYMLRQTLQNNHPDFPYVLCHESAYTLNPDLALWIDSETFDAHYKRGLQLERQGRLAEAINEYEMAESLYEGDFLAEDIYEEWPSAHRERLKHAHLDLLDRLSQHYWTQAQPATCIHYCLKILSDDNCREDVHRRLMLAYLRQGQRHLALRQYHRCVESLAQELGVDPMPATVELYQKLQNNSFQFPEA